MDRWMRDPHRILREIGRRVGVQPRPSEKGWNALELRFELAGRDVHWQDHGRTHEIRWVTIDCAIGITVADAKEVRRQPFKQLKNGLSILVPSTPWTTSLEDEALDWLADDDHVQLLESLPLGRRDYVTFGWPDCTALIRAKGPGDLDRIAALIAASDQMVDPNSRWLAEVAKKQRETIRWSRLPAEFQSLSRFSRQWGEGDDGIRSNRMDRASSKTLLDLHAAVMPLFGAFARYADEVDDDPPAAFFRLQRIVEAAAEAEIELERRKAT